jgi:hypothetical protein
MAKLKMFNLACSWMVVSNGKKIHKKDDKMIMGKKSRLNY